MWTDNDLRSPSWRDGMTTTYIYTIMVVAWLTSCLRSKKWKFKYCKYMLVDLELWNTFSKTGMWLSGENLVTLPSSKSHTFCFVDCFCRYLTVLVCIWLTKTVNLAIRELVKWFYHEILNYNLLIQYYLIITREPPTFSS